MQSPRPPSLVAAAASPAHATSFSSITDPTLHRRGWRSPVAKTDEPRAPNRKIPARYRSLLRYDTLSPAPPQPAHGGHAHDSTRGFLSARSASGRASHTGAGGALAMTARATTAPEPPPEETDETALQRKTNLDELKWFQHRWLDKHGKNSHLKEYREKMALLRRWFESLDADGSGEVGLDELEDPLVSVGLARSRDEVQKLIDEVDHDGSGEVTFSEFLSMMNPKKAKRARHRQPLHVAKPRAMHETDTAAIAIAEASTASATATRAGTPARTKKPGSSAGGGGGGGAAAADSASNPVVKLFEDLQSGKLGDLAIPFPVLITAYRRRMLLNAHMADDPAARRLGTSVLQALECNRHEATHQSEASHARRGSVLSPASYLRTYISTVEAAEETSRSHSPSVHASSRRRGSSDHSGQLPSL